MAKTHLTKPDLKKLVPRPGEQYIVWDRELPGFGVRVSGKGARAYIFKYRTTAGKQRWKTLGRVGALTLDDARRRAKRDTGLVSDNIDPLAAQDVARHTPTFGAVADRFLEEHVAARRKPATLRLYRLAIDKHLRPRFGASPITAITSADLARLHGRLRKTPYGANRTLATFSKLWNWAMLMRLVPTGPNPAKGIEKYPEEKRKRYLTPDELKRLGAALRVGVRRGRVSPSSATAIKLLMLTGARVGEVLGLQWADLDLERGIAHLPDSKTGARDLVLNEAAREVLAGWPKWATSPYVFPGERRGPRKGPHKTDLKDAWAWIRRRAKLPGLRPHDLRHSFASVAISNGQTLAMVGGLLGHTQAQTTARYAHLQDISLRAASEATGAIIAGGLTSPREARQKISVPAERGTR